MKEEIDWNLICLEICVTAILIATIAALTIISIF